MKKIVSIALALVLVLSCFSALAEDFVPAESYDIGERAYFGGNVTLTAPEAGGGSVNTTRYAGVEGQDYTDEKVYTYKTFTGSLTASSDWNPHTWETSDDGSILSMMTGSLYEFYLNEDGKGYAIIPEMAADYPVDVTSEYVGKYGVAEGETAKAFRIALNPDATWENGEPINADTYLYSLKQLLNPKMLNRRADTWYAGEFALVGAQAYLYSAKAGQTGYNKLGDATTTAALEAGEELFVDLVNFWGLGGALDAEGNECPAYVSVNDETLYRDLAVEDETAEEAWVSGKYIFETYLQDGAPYNSYAADYVFTSYIIEGGSWDEVGIEKVDEYTIDLIFKAPIAEANFYLPYGLSFYVVYEPMYEACKTFFDATGKEVETEEEAATVTTNYCKSLENSIGYGPYKMTYFELDKEYRFERNENWYGYKDGKHLGMYQTDVYSVSVIAEHKAAMMAFEKGELVSVSLDATDMEKYASSEYILYTPQSYTTKLTFNTDYEKLLSRGTNAQILVIDEFREGFAKSIDREYFATSFTASHRPGFGILNYMYIYDPFTGSTYRDNQASMEALVEVYGLTYGEGGEYDTLEDAYAAMTGYDMEAAKAAMKIAGEKAIASGIWDGVSPITLDFRVYQGDDIYVQMHNYFNTQVQEACKGSAFEGLLSLTMTVDADYYETNYSGGADMIFTTWGGSSFTPFSTFYQCYILDDGQSKMEYGFDPSLVEVTYNIDGTEMTATLQDWAAWGNAMEVEGITDVIGNFADYSYDTRCQIMAGVEKGLLRYYTTTPIYYRNVASLLSQQVNYPVKDYQQLVSFGGLPFMTYNYDDAAWAEYCANNTLVY